MRLITETEIKYCHNIEKVLGLPKNKLVRALIRDRSIAVQELLDRVEGLERMV